MGYNSALATEHMPFYTYRRVVKEAVGLQLPDLEEEVVGGSDDEGEGSETEQEDEQGAQGSQRVNGDEGEGKLRKRWGGLRVRWVSSALN
eukprot:1136803-Pelagomonas_calceolata.AAC.7